MQPNLRPDNLQSGPAISPLGAIPGAHLVNARWGVALVLLALVLAGVIGAFHATAASIVSIWMRSDTFAHGFAIIPITLWLIWEKRAGLRRLAPQPAFLPLMAMLPVGFAWLLGHLVDVLVVQQFAFVGLLTLAIWSVIGTPVARYLAFPLAFLFFAVPVGEGLIHPMINFTADFTVGMLRLTGIPVYRDGTFFSVPSGDWSVIEECSGVRYLIAAVTLGALYAYLTYERLWKRLVFFAISIVVPIVANGLRAYTTVMIGHLGGMELAVGAAHIIYGWVFFGIVITILFLIGSFWRDPPAQEPPPGMPETIRRGGSRFSALPAALGAVAIAGLWPGLAWTLAGPTGGAQAIRLEAPAVVQGWRSEERPPWDWRPHVVGADGELSAFYVNEGAQPVGLYLGVYRTQREGAELLNSQNVMVQRAETEQTHVKWIDKEQTVREIRLQGEAAHVNQNRLASPTGQRLLVWSWYRIGDRQTANPYLGKLIEAASILIGGRHDGALIAVAAPYLEKEGPAIDSLQAFVDAMLPSIDDELDKALVRSP